MGKFVGKISRKKEKLDEETSQCLITGETSVFHEDNREKRRRVESICRTRPHECLGPENFKSKSSLQAGTETSLSYRLHDGNFAWVLDNGSTDCK